MYDSTSDTQINYNDTYIQNPGYPSSYGESNSISYTVNKCSDGKERKYFFLKISLQSIKIVKSQKIQIFWLDYYNNHFGKSIYTKWNFVKVVAAVWGKP